MIYLIVFLAIVLRSINLNQSFWFDEAITVNVVNNSGFKELITNYAPGDFHPPLHYLILRIWSNLVPLSEISARSISVLLGAATVFTTYLVAKKFFEQKTALIASILIATSPLHIYYSQETRMYILAAFLVSLSVYFFISIIDKDSIANWTGFIVSTSLMLYSDYLPYLMIPVYFLYLILFRGKIAKSTFRGFIPAFLLILILISPWLLILPHQLKVGLSATEASPAWAQVVGSPSLTSFIITFVKFTIGRISNNNNSIYFLTFLPAALFVVLMFVLSLFRLSPKRSFLFMWFFIPIVSAFLIAYFIPVYAYFRFIFVLPAFYLIWASAINTVNIKKLLTPLLLSALLINAISLVIYYLNPKFQREDWKNATVYVTQEPSASTIALFESSGTIAPFDYYNKNKIPAFGALNSFNAQEDDVSQNIEKLTKKKDRVFLFQYLSGITDPTGIVFENLTEHGFRNISTRDFPGVGFVYEFKR